MTTFITLFLTIATFIFVIYPFFRQKLQRVDPSGDEKLQELRSERDITYSMLKELEFDYQSGILTEEDYKELESRYKRKAISTLRQLDDAGRGERTGADDDAEDEIEKQVRRLRGKAEQNAPPAKAAVAKEGVKSQSQNRFCTECGTQVRENDKFCANCGTKLK